MESPNKGTALWALHQHREETINIFYPFYLLPYLPIPDLSVTLTVDCLERARIVCRNVKVIKPGRQQRSTGPAEGRETPIG